MYLYVVVELLPFDNRNDRPVFNLSLLFFNSLSLLAAHHHSIFLHVRISSYCYLFLLFSFSFLVLAPADPSKSTASAPATTSQNPGFVCFASFASFAFRPLSSPLWHIAYRFSPLLFVPCPRTRPQSPVPSPRFTLTRSPVCLVCIVWLARGHCQGFFSFLCLTSFYLSGQVRYKYLKSLEHSFLFSFYRWWVSILDGATVIKHARGNKQRSNKQRRMPSPATRLSSSLTSHSSSYFTRHADSLPRKTPRKGSACTGVVGRPGSSRFS